MLFFSFSHVELFFNDYGFSISQGPLVVFFNWAVINLFITNSVYMFLFFLVSYRIHPQIFSFESGDMALGFHCAKFGNSQLTQNFFKIRMHMSFTIMGPLQLYTVYDFPIEQVWLFLGSTHTHDNWKICAPIAQNQLCRFQLFIFSLPILQEFLQSLNRFIFCFDFFLISQIIPVLLTYHLDFVTL